MTHVTRRYHDLSNWAPAFAGVVPLGAGFSDNMAKVAAGLSTPSPLRGEGRGEG